MKVLKLSLAKPVMIGSKAEDYIYEGGEVSRLYDLTFDNDLRVVSIKSKSQSAAPALLIPLENITSLQLSNENKADTPSKVSADGGTKKK